MKRVLIVLALLALATTAYAGPYFEIEQNPILPDAELIAGWDFSVPFVDMTNLSVSGDFFVINEDLWVYPTPWFGGFDLGFAWVNDIGRDVFEVRFGLDAQIVPALNDWALEVAVYGYPSSDVTLWGAIALDQAAPGAWPFVPTVGIECHWGDRAPWNEQRGY